MTVLSRHSCEGRNPDKKVDPGSKPAPVPRSGVRDDGKVDKGSRTVNFSCLFSNCSVEEKARRFRVSEQDEREKREDMFLESLAQEFNLDIIYAFGSRAREVADALASEGQALPESLSDVDIGVKPLPGQDLTVSDKVVIAQRIEDELDVSRVDLVCLPEADPFLAANVIRGERLYARDGHRADEYDLYILRRAGDCLHLERERLALIMGAE